MTQYDTTENEEALWRNKNFLLLWGGTTLSSFGMQMYTIAIPLFIYQMTQSPLAMSTMRAIEFFPNIILGILAGAIVDRYNRKKVMQLASFIQIVSMILLIVFVSTDQLQLWQLFLIGFMLSSAGYTLGNAQHSVMPQLISKEQLTSANAKMSFIQTFIQTIGPGIAGSFIVIFSFTSIFGIYFICLICLFICIQFLQLPTSTINHSPTSSIRKEIKEGIDELFHNKTLLTPTLAVIFINLASSLVVGVLVFYVVDNLNSNEKQIGWMFSISAIGGLVATLVISLLRKRLGRGNLFTYCLLIDVCSVLILVVAPTWWVVGIALAIRNFSTTISNIVYFTIRQEFTPNHLLGRVAGTSSMMMKLTLPLGLFLSGLWAEMLPISLLFILSAFLFLLLFFILYFHPFRKLS